MPVYVYVVIFFADNGISNNWKSSCFDLLAGNPKWKMSVIEQEQER